jgi:hypothetical protein
LRPALLAALCLHAAAAAADPNPWSLALSQLWGHDSNLLRLSNGEVAQPGYSRADSYTSTSLIAALDQPFGRQHTQANLSVRDSRYRDNPRFDNLAYTAAAGLDWSSAPRLQGSVTASVNRGLSTFSANQIGLLAEKNYETTGALDANASLGLVTPLTLELSAGHRGVGNSLQADPVQARDYQQDSASLGLRWRPGAAGTVGLGVRGVRGRYPRFRVRSDGSGYDADRFKQQSLDLSLSAEPSGASSLDARISALSTRYDLNGQRDFSGITGTLGWSWQATGRTRTTLRYTRDTGQDAYAIALFNAPAASDYSRLTHSLRLQADHELGAKASLTASWQWLHHAIVRTIDNPAVPADARGRDRSQLASLGARWAPRRSLLAGCDWSRESRRASGELTSDLDSTAFSCFGQFTLQ